MRHSNPTSHSNTVRVKRVPHWKKGQPLRHILFTPSQTEYKAIRLSSMKMRGFNHTMVRCLETKEVIVQGRDVEKILSDIKSFCPDITPRVEVPQFFLED